jgi:hypothetical protein
MQFLPWLKSNGFAWGNADFGTSAGVAANAGLPGADAKYPESTEFDAFARRQRFFQPFEDRVYRSFGFGAGKPGALDYMMDNVLLDQSGYLVRAPKYVTEVRRKSFGPGATEETLARPTQLMVQILFHLGNSCKGLDEENTLSVSWATMLHDFLLCSYPADRCLLRLRSVI